MLTHTKVPLPMSQDFKMVQKLTNISMNEPTENCSYVPEVNLGELATAQPAQAAPLLPLSTLEKYVTQYDILNMANSSC
jgi:hypothetical protein